MISSTRFVSLTGWFQFRERSAIARGLGGVYALVLLTIGGWCNDLPEKWEVRNDRCLALMRDGKILEGKGAAESFLAKAEAEEGRTNKVTAAALHWVAWFTQHSGDMAAAEGLWWRALAIDEALYGQESLGTARRLVLLGAFYREKADFRRSHELLLKALALREKHLGRVHPLTGRVLIELGKLCTITGEWDKAEEYLRRGLDIVRATATEYYPDENPGNVLVDLSWVQMAIGDMGGAEDSILEALALDRKYPEESRVNVPGRLDALSSVYFARKAWAEAENCLKNGLTAIEGLPPDRRREEYRAIFRLRLATACLVQGKSGEAERILIEEKDRPETGETPAGPLVRKELFLLLAGIHEQAGDLSAARSLLRKACEIDQKESGIAPAQIAVDLASLARIEWLSGRTNETLRLANQIQEAEEREMEEVLSFTSERQRLEYLGGYSKRRYSLWASMGAVQPLTRAVLRTKGLVLDSLLEDRMIATQNDSAERKSLIEELRLSRQKAAGLRSELSAAEGRFAQREYWAAELTKALGQVEAAEAALARQVGGVGRARRGLSAGREAIQRVLRPGSAAVELISFDEYGRGSERSERYGALVIRSQGEPSWVPLGPVKSIDNLVALYRHALRSPAEDKALERVIKQLYAAIWKPIAEALPRSTREIFLSPEGQLNFVSFSALLNPSGRFVGEEISVTYMSAARDLLEESASLSARRSLALWADPRFDEVPEQPELVGVRLVNRAATVRELQELRLEPLRGARWEGEQLKAGAKRFGFTEFRSLMGPDASEAELRRSAVADVLHFATHGFVLPAIPEHEMRREPASGKLWRGGASPRDNPMLRSGLALAGAQRTLDAWKKGRWVPPENDGILTAEEVAGLNLNNARLVVLSACDTGGGEAVAGDGVMGLRRGFIQAGVANLLMTLWQVDDERTARIMLDFYANMAGAGEGDPALALAEAQRTWLAKLRKEKGPATACRIAGPFVINSRGPRSASGANH